MKSFRLVCQWSLMAIIAGACNLAEAHEIRPASVEIVAVAGNAMEFRWRQPIAGDFAIAIQPVLSSGWLDTEPDNRLITDTAQIKRWNLPYQVTDLAGQTLSIKGLNRTITDVLVTVIPLNAAPYTHLIKAADPVFVFPEEARAPSGTSGYLWLGISHIWSGADHLAYVLGLLLLIRSRRALLITITAFTLAHSLTLAGAVLGLVHVSPEAIEAVIALSIVYVAVELVRVQRGQAGLASRHPGGIACGFGLLHGFGFAGALLDIGLPEQATALALLLFNIGIELGQLAFVFAVILPGAVMIRLHPQTDLWARTVTPYAIGSAASFWLLERVLLII